ncbi:MAG TPA: glycosyltransferase family 2 protein, partial [Chitinophagales bacterium]
MISICIPVYNFDVSRLINELVKQASELNVESEIILIDDCSQKFKEKNRYFDKLSSRIHFYELSENIGRARIRNLFLDYAKFDYLLFLDCDSLVEKNDFLATYFEVIKQESLVVCGGRVYPKERPERAKLLRWKYGVFRESQTAEVRKLNPNKSFMTNNFLIHKSVFQQIKFDERIRQYGHEDTLFGLALQKKNITITHIENPIVNGDIETNSEFLRKTKESIVSLVA